MYDCAPMRVGRAFLLAAGFVWGHLVCEFITDRLWYLHPSGFWPILPIYASRRSGVRGELFTTFFDECCLGVIEFIILFGILLAWSGRFCGRLRWRMTEVVLLGVISSVLRWALELCLTRQIYTERLDLMTALVVSILAAIFTIRSNSHDHPSSKRGFPVELRLSSSSR